MNLGVMYGVHDKAPVMKKDNRKGNEEGCQTCFHGPKTGPHGSHVMCSKPRRKVAGSVARAG
eukprot:6439625-Heterocapsa_arctica.AAC.1